MVRTGTKTGDSTARRSAQRAHAQAPRRGRGQQALGRAAGGCSLRPPLRKDNTLPKVVFSPYRFATLGVYHLGGERLGKRGLEIGPGAHLRAPGPSLLDHVWMLERALTT